MPNSVSLQISPPAHHFLYSVMATRLVYVDGNLVVQSHIQNFLEGEERIYEKGYLIW